MSEQKWLSHPGISPLTAEFTDPDTEKAYRQRNIRANIGHARLGLGLWAVLLVFFIYSDFAALGTEPGFWVLLAMRVTVSLVILIFAIIIGRYPALVMNGHGVAALLIFGWSAFFLVFFFLPKEVMPWTIAMVMSMLIGQYVFIPNRVLPATATALYAIAGTLVSVHLAAGTGPAKLVALAMVLVAPAATGLFVCHRFQFEHRRAFAMLLGVENTNIQLQKEIEARKKLETELKRQADTDPLTGLYNRRRYEAMFLQEFRRIQRYGGAMSLLVLDLDHFKQVNDAHGHAAGDNALQKLAALFRRQLRSIDIPGRLGGEEFLILLPGTALSDALVVAERLRKEIETTEIRIGKIGFYLTVTIGVAEITKNDRGIKDLVRRADQALYRGKSAGRNRVETG